jgi:prepilin signal peptidase PulO-like enzyme (type II secretory pathway)
MLVPDGQEEEEFEVSAQHIPFGPYLAFGSALCVLFGDRVITLVQQLTNQYWGAAWPH